MFNGIEQIFAPSRQYVQAERERLELTRDEDGDGKMAGGPIDLDSGKITIRV